MAIIKVKVLGEEYLFDGDDWALNYGQDPADTKAIREDITISITDALYGHFGDTLDLLVVKR